MFLLLCSVARAADTGSIAGEVVLRDSGQPLHHADVLLPRLGRKVETDPFGRFRMEGVPTGRHVILAHLHGLSDARKFVEVTAGADASVRFELELSAVREQITVTASGKTETALETFVSVISASQLDLAAKSGSTSLGDLLEDQAGIHKRSFGPGTTRPVVRGFDGDRVLVLEDGVRTGTLSSQSGDHGEPVDPNQLDRVEVVRGPATLLYGSNAIGGVVNAITREHEMHDKPHGGLSGTLSATGGSNNGQAGGGTSLRYGIGDWLLSFGGGGMRAGDYHAGGERIGNSATRAENGRFGIGRYGERAAFLLQYSLQDGRYGVPFAAQLGGEGDEEIDVGFRRQQARFTGSLRDLGRYFEQFTLKLNYTDWKHRELEGESVGTEFFNKQFVYRGEFRQRRKKNLTGSFGFWGMTRDFESRGAEALAPPVDQTAFAVFALEEFDLDRVRLQFGGRVERNSYDALDAEGRSFTGVSASAGVNAPVWNGGAFVANYTHSYRAPSIEELYNNGPHLGNLTFELGNVHLRRERSEGVDLSLRHQHRRFRGEANLFVYSLADFVYLAPTGAIEDGLPEANYEQADARYTGGEVKASAGLTENVWLNGSFDMVRATLTQSGTALPRIPPVSGRVGLDLRHKGFSARPELVLARRQSRVFDRELPTAGYAAGNVSASYTIAVPHALHVFTVNLFNVSDRLYRNHLSFIKAFAPEMGRGVRFAYNLNFY